MPLELKQMLLESNGVIGQTAVDTEPFPTWLRQGPGKAVLLRD